jgi:hypothetical protein
LPVEYIEKAVSIGDRHKLPRLSLEDRIDEDGHVIRVPIVCVVRRELKIPL